MNRLDELPEYMRLCFLVVYNEVNNIGCDILRNKDINVIPFLRKSVSKYQLYIFVLDILLKQFITLRRQFRKILSNSLLL